MLLLENSLIHLSLTLTQYNHGYLTYVGYMLWSCQWLG